MSRLSFANLRLQGYEPLFELAAGGMATVYVARRVGAGGFERLVVIKRVHQHLLANRDFCDMFRDEARVCSTIRHPNVVPVIDVIEADAELFLVLEYVESMALSAVLRAAAGQGERLDPRLIVRVFSDLLAGLHAAHEAVDLRGQRIEIIHRDVSPQNVIVGVDGTSRLIDFGIAKAHSRIGVTDSGVVKGKLRYMSPEQVQQKPLDKRSDVFAAGVVLYETLTGVRPFGGEDDGDVVLGILLGDIAAPSSIATGLPPAIDAVVAKALDRDREARFQTAAEFQEALEHALSPAPSRDVASLVQRLGAEVFDARRVALQDALADAAGRPPDAVSSDAQPKAAAGLSQASTLITGSSNRKVWSGIAIGAIAAASLVAVAMTRSSAPASTSAVLPAPSSSPGPVEPPATSLVAAAVSVPESGTPARPAHAPESPRRPERSRVSPSQDLHRRSPYGVP